MIHFSLRCSKGHAFDDWFTNGAEYDAKAAAGELACPSCGDTAVEKGIMAPSVGGKTADPAPMPACGMGGCGGGMCQFG